MFSYALLALAIASFGIGTTEFVIMGLLPDVAGDLHTSVPRAGMLVSGYALSVALGSPVVAVVTARLPRKTALLALMGVFITGNLCCALAPSYALLMAARVLTALAHGAFFGIGALVAVGLVERAKRTQAVAMLLAGLTVANVFGVPLGTALGQAAGWRAAFWAVSAIGVVAAAALALALPSGMRGSSSPLTHEFRALGQRRVLLPMLISTLASISLFSVFTYIAPLLQQVSGLAPRQVTWALLLFGVGLTMGNLIGGRLADWRLVPSVIASFSSLVVVLLLFAFTCHFWLAGVVTLMVWGGIAFALISPLQMWVVDASSDAPNLASTLNQGAFNLGNSIGAWMGGAAIGAGVSYAQLPLLGAVVAALALGVTLVSYVHEHKSVTA